MSDTLTFRKRELKGSRFRCLLATHYSEESEEDVARFLSNLAGDAASVSAEDQWYPKGFLKSDEARLDKSDFKPILSNAQREEIRNWWLVNHKGANTPNWDIASTCQVGEARGILLVEAKAHCGEFKDDHSTSEDPNYSQIKRALLDASDGWNKLVSGFNLDADHWYQLSNRFALAWKLAQMGIPVVLVYLGFLNAYEMTGMKILHDTDQWRRCIHSKTKHIVPVGAWDRTFHINGTPLSVLIRTTDVQIEVGQVGR